MSLKKISILPVAAMLVMVFGGFSIVGAEVNIVSIDTNKILQKYPPFLEAQEEFQAEQQKMQKRLQEMDEDEKQMGQQMIQQQLQQMGARLEAEASQSLQEDIGEIADDKGYDYVMDKNVMFAGAEDVTDEIADELDLKEQSPAGPSEGSPGGEVPLEVE
ncbi:MAG: OmpH family outer membrane protein [Elusimicrobiota bacterium]